MRGQEADLNRAVEEQRDALSMAVSVRTAAEAALATAEQELRAAVRAASDRREGVVRLQGQVNAARSRAEARASEIERLRGQVQAARERATRADQEFRTLEASIAGLDEGEVDLDSGFESAQSALGAVDDQIAELAARESQVERTRAGLAARVEALAPMIAVADASGELAGGAVPGVSGTLAPTLRVEPGYEVAIGAALGAAADAALAEGAGSALAALEWLAADDRGRAAVLVPELGATDRAGWPSLPDGARYAIECVTSDGPAAAALAALLDRVAVVDGDLSAALDVAGSVPGLLVVTRTGDLVGRGLVVGGSQAAPSRVEVTASLEQARSRAGHRRPRRRAASVRAGGAAHRAGVRRPGLRRGARPAARVRRPDGRRGRAVGQPGPAVAGGHWPRPSGSTGCSRPPSRRWPTTRATLAELSERMDRATRRPGRRRRPLPGCARRGGAGRRGGAAGRGGGAAGGADQRGARPGHRRACRAAGAGGRQRAHVPAPRRRAPGAPRPGGSCGPGRRRGRRGRARPARRLGRCGAAEARTAAEQARAASDAELSELRARIRGLAADLEELTSSVHRDEVARAEQRLRIENLANRAMSEFGLETEALIADYGPDQLVPPSLRAPGDDVDPNAPEPAPYPYVRAEQERRLKTAEKAMALLGKVNPLALEEFAALEERHRFLTEQLDDLKRSRKDLLDLINDVDARVEEVFTAAYADVAVQFEQVFARLFPGGAGRLVLTDPENMLTTGIEVEARPPGKKIKRLSLLSGGERSLTAVAFLVSLFQARPSPFYVLDEVEAALDDVNLGRLLDVLEELRENSQLIVITHQKRTMEIADALYGVSMRGDGVTHVISQRMRERQAG